MPPLGFLPSWTTEERVRAELEILGLNVSAHPLSFLRDELRALKVTRFHRLPQIRHGSRVRLAGVLERAQMPWIRSGHRTLFLTLEDETELAQVVVFNDVYLEYGRVLKSAIYLLVEGELQNDEEHGLAVVAKRVYDLLEVVRNGGSTPLAPRPVKRSADDHKGTPQPEQPGGGGGRAAGTGSGAGDRTAPTAPAASAGTPLGSGGNVYPWDGPAPEDTRLGPPARRLTMPKIEPRTRPGRTG
jgi:error-prone DNA polymerase